MRTGDTWHCPTHICAMTCLQISKDSTRSGFEKRAVACARIRTCCLSGLIHMFAMTLSHRFHDAFIRLPWFIHMCERARARVLSRCRSGSIYMCVGTLSHGCHDSLACVPWRVHTCEHVRAQFWACCLSSLIHMRDMTHSCVPYYLFICVPSPIHICVMTRPFHSHVWHDSFICAPLPMHLCATTHSRVCNDSSICASGQVRSSRNVLPVALCCSAIQMCGDLFCSVTWPMCRCDMTRSHV